MKLLKNMSLTFSFVLWVCFNIAPAAYAWTTFEQLHKIRYNILIRKVHADYWTIGWVYMDCPPEKMNNNAALEAAMTRVIQTWLQPVRDLNPGEPVVNDFRYEHKEKIWGEEAHKPFDLVVRFFCRFDRSGIGMAKLIPPVINMRRGTEVTWQFMQHLLHEMGHAFGLADTYTTQHATREDLMISKGGLTRNIGHQPSSVMSVFHNPTARQALLNEDDKNGIVWLYKFYYENLPLEDCIFPDYELEESPMGCVPKHPLIFEIKYGNEGNAVAVLEDDKNTKVNAKDRYGLTALHYAIRMNYPKVVETLIDRENLDVNVKDPQGNTPLHIAAKRGYTSVVRNLVLHDDLDVNAKDAQGHTALFYAAKEWNAEIENLIRDHENFDISLHQTLVKISGDTQQATAGTLLTSPFVVEARDIRNQPMPDAVVTFTIDEGGGMLAPITITTGADGRASTTLALGWTPGTTTIRATAEGVQGEVLFTATATALPEQVVPEDVNADGSVTVEDLVLVASSFGAAPPLNTLPNTDVNSDSEVNNEDVLLVLAALEGAPAAPAADAHWAATSLQRWVAEVKLHSRNDPRLQRGLLVLEQLLAGMLPTQTILLLNYPNPFNPETWIPYQLAEPADVSVRIYAAEGGLVRRLALGHRPAGTYQSRVRAAYWDGRNEQGESVASGVYFYTLSAGHFTATRKMVIQK